MSALQQMLVSQEAAAEMIGSGSMLVIAGDEAVLATLPCGNWIGGTTSYFMGQEGGVTTRDRVFVTPIPSYPESPASIKHYDAAMLSQVCRDAPANGFSLIILPAFSQVHIDYAEHAGTYDEMFMKPLVGWIAGMHLDDLGACSPKVRDGRHDILLENLAVVMHVPLPENLSANVNIVNVFEQGHGDVLTFREGGFEVSRCLVNGASVSLARYLRDVGHDRRLPLVADYCGAIINVSLRAIDEAQDTVAFYGPVFPNVPYKLASSVDSSYEAAFNQALAGLPEREMFSCNCILNYLYSELEGKRTGNVTGPVTFGEIAYVLLNQTMVHLTLENHAREEG